MTVAAAMSKLHSPLWRPRKASSPTASDAEVSELTTTELIRLFLDRRLAWLAKGETPPSGNEIQQLLKAQLMLHHREAYIGSRDQIGSVLLHQ